jgi:acyl carrier protein
MEAISYETLNDMIDDVLGILAIAKAVPPESPPALIVFDSLDQMRLLVAIEDRLQIIFDDAALQPFCLDSRDALVKSVVNMMKQQR